MKPADILVDNPVLNREFRGRLRMRKLSGKAWRVVGVIVVLTVLRYYYVLLASVVNGRPDDAVELWRDVSFLALTLIALLAPALAATAISQEQEQQTWDLLKVTRLTAWQVILGKWLARQTIPAMALLIGLPLVLVCSFHGGLGFTGFAVNYGYLILTSAFFSAMGLWCSAVARKTAAATAASLMAMAALCLGTCVVDAIIDMLMTYHRWGLGTYTVWINPFYALGIVDDLIKNPYTWTEMYQPYGPYWDTVRRISVGCTSVCFEIVMIVIFLSSLVRRYGQTAGS